MNEQLTQQIADLQKEKDIVYFKVKETTGHLRAAEKSYHNILKLHREQCKEFKILDIQLAELDGRFKRLERKKSRKKKLTFSKSEIFALAEALGILDEVKGI